MTHRFYRLLAFVTGTILGCAATITACSAYGADCFIGDSYDKCFGSGRASLEALCEACIIAGSSVNYELLDCYTDNECADTNDTATLAKINDCVAGKAMCE